MDPLREVTATSGKLSDTTKEVLLLLFLKKASTTKKCFSQILLTIFYVNILFFLFTLSFEYSCSIF